jgi:hypothetical protein
MHWLLMLTMAPEASESMLGICAVGNGWMKHAFGGPLAREISAK